MTMKTKEELNAIKKEFDELNVKLRELTQEEMAQVIGSEADKENWGECPEKLEAPDRAICNSKCRYFTYVTAADATTFHYCELYRQWIDGPWSI